MFRHIYYNNHKSEIAEQTWDEEGNRVTIKTPFKPFLFVETNKKTKYKTIYNTYAEYKKFDNSWKRNEFVKDDNRRLFFNLQPEQQYAITKYKDCDKDKFSEKPLRTFFLDIECPSPNEFPEPQHAKHEIDLMTIYDSLTETYHMWGREKWNQDDWKEEIENLGGKIQMPKNVEYYHIQDEKERLKHMVNFWEKNCPDIVTHWNGKNFDMPYIVNRLKLLFKGNFFKKLSPVFTIIPRSGFDNFGNPQENVQIKGLNDMDYQDVFKVMTMNKERPSWALDAVASDVLGCGKIEHGYNNLYELSKQNWSKYCAYNLVDVALLVSMEKEREYLEVARGTAYVGFSNPVEALGKINVITAAINVMSLMDGKLMHSKPIGNNESFEGGFVLPPKVGLQTDIESVDIKSLYPTNMIGLNISPETKMGKFDEHTGLKYTDVHESTQQFGSKEEVKKWLKKNNFAVSAVGVVFRQDIIGYVTQFVTQQFADKEHYGKLQKEALKEKNYEAAAQYGRLREIAKVLANSIYGAISSYLCSLYDIDLARSVTLTGQAVNKRAHDFVRTFSREKFGIDEDVVVASDTDSTMISLTPILEKYRIDLFNEEGGLSKKGNDLCNIFTKMLNKKINAWCKEEFNMAKPEYIFEREKVALAGLFFAKKQYAYHVNNNDGFDLPPEKRMKYTGLKVIKSEFSEGVKKMFDELYYETLSNYREMGEERTRKHLEAVVLRHRKEFMEMDFFDVAKRAKANKIHKYEDHFFERYKAKAINGTGVPAQTKSCILHNRLVEDLELQANYPKLQGGTKALWVYIKPDNPYKIECVAGSNGILPPEFGLEIDYEKQFEKMYMAVYHQLFETLGWRKVNLYFEEEVDLLSEMMN